MIVGVDDVRNSSLRPDFCFATLPLRMEILVTNPHCLGHLLFVDQVFMKVEYYFWIFLAHVEVYESYNI